MITLFIAHATQDAACAEQIRTSLEARGYSVSCEPSSSSPQSLLNPPTIEQAITNSAAIVLLWSSAAAQSKEIEQHVMFAQQLRKQVVPMLLDGTALPIILVAGSPIMSQGDCAQVAAQIIAQLPPASSTNAVPPPPLAHPDDTNPIFGVRCKNGHISYFDKRVVCKASVQVPHILDEQTGKELDELLLPCSTCGAEAVAHVDCGGYR